MKEKSSMKIIIIINKYIKNINVIRNLIRTTRRLKSDDIYVITFNEKKIIILRNNKK